MTGDPVTIWSNWDDIELRRSYGRLESATMRYNIIAKEAAHADVALRRDAPEWFFGTLYRTETSVSRLGPRAFEGTAEYSMPEGKNFDDGGFELSFDTSGGMQHIKQSYQTLGRHAASGAQPNNYHGAIGVHDGSIAGCDVIVPSLSFTLSHRVQGSFSMSFTGDSNTTVGKNIPD